jgi:hypothetical protein
MKFVFQDGDVTVDTLILDTEVDIDGYLIFGPYVLTNCFHVKLHSIIAYDPCGGVLVFEFDKIRMSGVIFDVDMATSINHPIRPSSPLFPSLR